jgi:hypothetical protein
LLEALVVRVEHPQMSIDRTDNIIQQAAVVVVVDILVVVVVVVQLEKVTQL